MAAVYGAFRFIQSLYGYNMYNKGEIWAFVSDNGPGMEMKVCQTKDFRGCFVQ